MTFEETMLKKFYRKWYQWAMDGGPDANAYAFSNKMGLCGNLYNFLWVQGLAGGPASALMQDQWEEEGLNCLTPFNSSPMDYRSEVGEKHLNPERLEWCRLHM